LTLLATGDELVDGLEDGAHLLGDGAVGLDGFGDFVNDGLDNLLSEDVGLLLVAADLWGASLAGNVRLGDGDRARLRLELNVNWLNGGSDHNLGGLSLLSGGASINNLHISGRVDSGGNGARDLSGGTIVRGTTIAATEGTAIRATITTTQTNGGTTIRTTQTKGGTAAVTTREADTTTNGTTGDGLNDSELSGTSGRVATTETTGETRGEARAIRATRAISSTVAATKAGRAASTKTSVQSATGTIATTIALSEAITIATTVVKLGGSHSHQSENDHKLHC